MPGPNHLMNIDSIGNITYIKQHHKSTLPSIVNRQILDTLTGHTDISRSFRPSARQCEYTMLLDLQERLAQQGNNSLPRDVK